MNDKEIIREIKRLFAKDRAAYLEALPILKDNWKSWSALKKDLKFATGQPVGIDCVLPGDVVEWILNATRSNKPPQFEFIDNASHAYCIVLNKGITNPLDYWIRLASHCGGETRFCHLYVSMILPLYTIHTYYLKYSRNKNWLEIGRLATPTSFEQNIVKSIMAVMNKMKFIFVDERIASKRIRSAYTDINSNGNASIFECLFDDLQYDYGFRERRNVKSIKESLTSAKVNWCEKYNSNGALEQKEIYRQYPSGDRTATYMDGMGRITRIQVSPERELKHHANFTIDVENRIKRLK